MKHCWTPIIQLKRLPSSEDPNQKINLNGVLQYRLMILQLVEHFGLEKFNALSFHLHTTAKHCMKAIKFQPIN